MTETEIPKSKVLIPYVPTQLSTGKDWFVYYYAVNPSSGKLQRIRIKINRIKSLMERRKFAKVLMNEINTKLYSGWNPFVADDSPLGYHRFSEVIPMYLNVSKRETRKMTYKSYESMMRKLEVYLKNNQMWDGYIVNFTPDDARRVMRFIEVDYGLSGVTFNNNKTMFVIFFNWLINGGYIRKNPFIDIKSKKESHKKRIQYIEPEMRKKIINYFDNTNKGMSLFIKLMHHCLIRPGELVQLKLENIDFKKQTLNVPSFIAKNKKERFATIPNVLFIELIDLDWSAVKLDYFLFGWGTMTPGPIKIETKQVGFRWRNMRKSLGLPNELQVYSLRDTGIIQKLKDGISPDEVMYQADHSSLSITNKYVRIAKPRIYDDIKNKSSAF